MKFRHFLFIFGVLGLAASSFILFVSPLSAIGTSALSIILVFWACALVPDEDEYLDS